MLIQAYTPAKEHYRARPVVWMIIHTFQDIYQRTCGTIRYALVGPDNDIAKHHAIYRGCKYVFIVVMYQNILKSSHSSRQVHTYAVKHTLRLTVEQVNSTKPSNQGCLPRNATCLRRCRHNYLKLEIDTYNYL